MSGSVISTGILTNKGAKLLEIERISNLQIKDITIHIIPLTNNGKIKKLRNIGRFCQFFLHPALTPTFCHVAIQLNMENKKDIIIMEYGQYLSEESELISQTPFDSSESSNNPRIHNDEALYFYINKDGARITKINDKYFFGNDISKIPKEEIDLTVLKVIASYHHNISYEEINKRLGNYIDEYYRINCDINNKMNLKELLDHFKEEKWEAKNYCVLTNNCQDFACKIIKILKAVRSDEKTKIRTIEKMILPNSLIGALWDNEKLSFTNTMGRIPIIGLIYDLIILNK